MFSHAHVEQPHTAPASGASSLPANWMAHLPKPVPANSAAPINDVTQHAPNLAPHHAAFNPADSAALIHHDAAPVISTVGVPEVINTPPVIA